MLGYIDAQSSTGGAARACACVVDRVAVDNRDCSTQDIDSIADCSDIEALDCDRSSQHLEPVRWGADAGNTAAVNGHIRHLRRDRDTFIASAANQQRVPWPEAGDRIADGFPSI